MIIGISGKIGSGKDTLAEMLMDRMRSHNFQVRKFAGKLKEMVAILTGCSISDLEDQDFKNKRLPALWTKYELLDFLRPTGIVYGSLAEAAKAPSSNSQHSYTIRESRMTYRELLQKLGTEGVRNVIHPNAWVNALIGENRGQNWIITDVRFPNEADAVKATGGVMIRIERPGGIVDNHPSETSLDNYPGFDFLVSNSGDLNYLSNQAKDIVSDLTIRL